MTTSRMTGPDIGMVVTDLDGTLLNSGGEVSAEDRATLEELGERGILRVIATGRSLYSARRVLRADFPIDFLAHTSGAGVLSWPDQRPLRAANLARERAQQLATLLTAAGCDFMLHRAIPENHRFYAHRHRSDNRDFERRIELYAAFAEELRWPRTLEAEMCQAVIIEPPGSTRHTEFCALLEQTFRVVRSTSPLDQASPWTEVFPVGVGKSYAAAWLCEQFLAKPARCIAIGNDYNDIDLLSWAHAAYVVANAPADLRARFATVASHETSGFSVAVRHALSDAAKQVP